MSVRVPLRLRALPPRTLLPSPAYSKKTLSLFLRDTDVRSRSASATFLVSQNATTIPRLFEKDTQSFSLSVILLPRLDLQVLHAQLAEGFDKGRSKTGIGDEWNVMVNGTTTNAVTVGEFTL